MHKPKVFTDNTRNAGFLVKDAIMSTPNLIVLYFKFISSFSSGIETYSMRGI